MDHVRHDACEALLTGTTVVQAAWLQGPACINLHGPITNQ